MRYACNVAQSYHTMCNKVTRTGSYKQFLASNAHSCQSRSWSSKPSNSERKWYIFWVRFGVWDFNLLNLTHPRLIRSITTSSKIYINIICSIMMVHTDYWLYPLNTKCAPVVACVTMDLWPGYRNPANTQLQTVQSYNIDTYINFADTHQMLSVS